jgi:hypothetical protein
MIAFALRQLSDRLTTLPTPDDRPAWEALAGELREVAALVEAWNRLPDAYRQAGEDPSPVAVPVPDPAPPPAAEPSPGGHRMVRRLRGGYLPDIHVTVPESAIRLLDAHDGDILDVEPLDGAPLGPGSLCHFRLRERTADAPQRERREVRLAVLESAGGRLVATRQAGGDGLPEPLVVPPDDVVLLGLTAGDVVDLAYWADAPGEVRVAWHHREVERGSAVPPSQPATGTKRRRPRPAPPAVSDTEKPAATGRSALIVGCEPRRQQFAQALARHGVSMDWASGNEGQARLAAAVQRADAVVVMTKMVSHQTSQDVPEFAKAAGAPYRLCSTNGIRTVTHAVLALLDSA